MNISSSSSSCYSNHKSIQEIEKKPEKSRQSQQQQYYQRRGNSLSFTLDRTDATDKENVDDTNICLSNANRAKQFMNSAHLSSVRGVNRLMKHTNGFEFSTILRDSQQKHDILSASSSSREYPIVKGFDEIKHSNRTNPPPPFLHLKDDLNLLNKSPSSNSNIDLNNITSTTHNYNSNPTCSKSNNESEILVLYNTLKEEFQKQARQLADVSTECIRATDESQISQVKVSELSKVVADQQSEIDRLRGLSEMHCGQNQVLRTFIKESDSASSKSKMLLQQQQQQQQSTKDLLADENEKLKSLNSDLGAHLSHFKRECLQLQSEKDCYQRKIKGMEFEAAQMAINTSLQNKTFSTLQVDYQHLQKSNEELQSENIRLQSQLKTLGKSLESRTIESQVTTRQYSENEQQLIAMQNQMREHLAETTEQLQRSEDSWRCEKQRLNREIAALQSQLKKQQTISQEQIAFLQESLAAKKTFEVKQQQQQQQKAASKPISIQENSNQQPPQKGIKFQSECAPVTTERTSRESKTQRPISSESNSTQFMQSRIEKLEATILQLKDELTKKDHENPKPKVEEELKKDSRNSLNNNSHREETQKNVSLKQNEKSMTPKSRGNASTAATAALSSTQPIPQSGSNQCNSNAVPVYQNNYFCTPFDSSMILNLTRDSDSSHHHIFDQQSQFRKGNNSRSNSTYVVAPPPHGVHSTTTERWTNFTGNEGNHSVSSRQNNVQNISSSSERFSKTSRQMQMDNLMQIYQSIKRNVTPTSR